MSEQKQNNLIVRLPEEHAPKKDKPHKNSPITGKSDREIMLWKKNIGKGVTKLTEEVVQKLCDAFAIDLDEEEACSYAEISIRTYYYWIKDYPELLHKFEHYRSKLSIASKANIAQKIHGQPPKGDPEMSKWFLLNRKRKDYHEKFPNEDDSEEMLNRAFTPEQQKRYNDACEKAIREIIVEQAEKEEKQKT
jgi:hypothetical protein